MAAPVAVNLSATDNFSTVMGKMLRSLDAIAGAHMGYTVAAIATTAAVTKSISVAAEYETQLAKVNTMLSLGEERFLPGYATEMKNLAAISGQSTQTLSDGLYDILSASRGAEGAIKILAATTGAAIGGFTNVAVATSGALTTLNAFGLANEDITSILDRQFATVKRGRLTYEQYANNIGQLAATSSLAGQSLEAMNASVATVTRGGISAERAITQINRAIMTFIKPATEAKAAAEKYGIELGVNAVAGDNLSKTLAKLKTLSAEQLAEIFRDIRGYKAISILTQNYAGFVRDLGEQHNAAGDAARAQTKAEDRLNFQIERSVQIFKNAGESIGGVFTPALKEALKAINDTILALKTIELSPEIWMENQLAVLEALNKTRDLTLEERVLVVQLNKALENRLENEEETARFIQRAVNLTNSRSQAEIGISDSIRQQLEHQKNLVKIVEKVAEIRAKSLAARTSAALSPLLPKTTDVFKGIFDPDLIERQEKRQNELNKELAEEDDLHRQIAASIANQATKYAGLQRAIAFVNEERERAAKGVLVAGFETTRGGAATGLEEQEETNLLPGAIAEGRQSIIDFESTSLEAYNSLAEDKKTIDDSYYSWLEERMTTRFDSEMLMAQISTETMLELYESTFNRVEDTFARQMSGIEKAGGRKFWRGIAFEANKALVSVPIDYGKEWIKSKVKLAAFDKVNNAKNAAIDKAARILELKGRMAVETAKTYARAFAFHVGIYPPTAPALAAANTAQMLAAVAPHVAAGSLHGGIDEVPLSGDNKSYILKGGERVLQPAANKEFMALMEVIKGQGLDNTIGAPEGGSGNVAVSVFLGLREIRDIVVEVVNDASRDGDLVIDPRAILA